MVEKKKKKFHQHEAAKKCEYNQHVLETGQVNSERIEMGEEFKKFVTALPSKLSEKQNEEYSVVMATY